MKTDQLERWLLLEQSGELPPRRLRRLEQALLASEEGRRMRVELIRLNESIREPDTTLSPWMVSGIHARLQDVRCAPLRFSGVWKSALATAACLAVAFGLWTFHGGGVFSTSDAVVAVDEADVWYDPFEEKLSELENLIVAISGDSLDIMEM